MKISSDSEVKKTTNKGRKKIIIDDFPEYYKRYKTREFSKTELAKKLNISRPTLDKLIKQFEQK